MELFKLNCIAKLVLGTSAVFLSMTTGYAKDSMSKEHVSQTQVEIKSPWALETGMRYWLGFGKYVKDLYGSIPEAGMVSRLTYENYVSNSAEAFWRLGHYNGVFIKGYFGGGSINGGRLIDEDFPPVTVPYSSTNLNQKNGTLNYFSADLGYDLIQQEFWRLGGFIGYHRWMERYNSFGCEQLAGNREICGNVSTPYTVDVLNNNAVWNSLRLGANGFVNVSDTLNLIVDVAYVRSNLTANDYHNLRPDIRGMLEDGSGNGVQLEALLAWQYTPNLNLGIGGRWWSVVANGFSHFEQQPMEFGQAQKAKISHDSYGLLLQANYQFDDTPIKLAMSKEPVSNLVFDWSGFYVGGNLGYGTNAEVVHIIPYASAPEDLASLTPHVLNTQDSGFLAGGQAGYNWLRNGNLFGLEGDLDYAHISSANAVTAYNTNLITSVAKNTQWIGSIRGRIGRLASENMLVYLTAGPAWGRADLLFAQNPSQLDNAFLSTRKTKTDTGWTGGGGVEYAVTNRIAFKAEYLYLGLGNSSLNFYDPGAQLYQVKSKFNNNLIRLGANYKI